MQSLCRPLLERCIRSRLLRDAQLLVESVSLRLATKELLKDVHFLLGTAALEDGMAVAATFSRVHRVRLEDSVEHVCGVDLGREVAIVAVLVSGLFVGSDWS